MILGVSRRGNALEFIAAERNHLARERGRSSPDQSPIERNCRPRAKDGLRLRRQQYWHSMADQRRRVARMVLMPMRHDSASKRGRRKRIGESSTRSGKASVDHDTAIDVGADRDVRGPPRNALHTPPRDIAEPFDGERHETRSGVCHEPYARIHFMESTRPALFRPGAQFYRPKARTEMIEELKKKLGDEVEKLQHELNVTLPNEIRKAVELGDLRENSEYKAALERQQFVRARLGQLRERLSKLASIDMTQIPTDRVGLGSKVVIEDQKSGAKETYNLVFGDALEFEEGQVTMASPIGRALLGKAIGEVAYLKLPTIVRQLKVVELRTIHDEA